MQGVSGRSERKDGQALDVTPTSRTLLVAEPPAPFEELEEIWPLWALKTIKTLSDRPPKRTLSWIEKIKIKLKSAKSVGIMDAHHERQQGRRRRWLARTARVNQELLL